jgi:hypothetical protein
VTPDRDDQVRAAMTVDDALDDIKRAQIWSRIEDRLTPTGPVRAWWRTLWRPAVPAGVLAMAIVVGVLAIGRLRRDRDGDTLAAPAGTTLSTPLGPHARASLIGPAHLDVLETGATTTARLRTGTLLAEFSGGSGRALRVEAPGLTVVVVGTLFAVDVRDGKPTCVSVEHGRVRVERRGVVEPVFVAGGERWCDGDHAVGAILDETAQALTRHEAAAGLSASVDHEPETPPVVAQVVTPTAVPPTIASTTPPAVVETHPLPPPAPAREHVDVPPRIAVASPPVIHVTPPIAPPPPPPSPVAKAPTPTPLEAPASAATPAAITASASPVLSPAHVEAPASVAPAPPASMLAPAASTPAPAASTPPPAPRIASPEDLYATAEAALAHGNRAAAEHALADLIARFPTSTIVDQALYERAQLAYRRHGYQEAQTALAGLAQLSSTPLAEQGAYLTCRIAVETHDSSAHACIVTFRGAHARSPHDLDLLGWLVDEAMHDGGCMRATPFVDELTRSYGTSQLAHAWQRRCPKPQ